MKWFKKIFRKKLTDEEIKAISAKLISDNLEEISHNIVVKLKK